jgi:hypothetical protein
MKLKAPFDEGALEKIIGGELTMLTSISPILFLLLLFRPPTPYAHAIAVRVDKLEAVAAAWFIDHLFDVSALLLHLFVWIKPNPIPFTFSQASSFLRCRGSRSRARTCPDTTPPIPSHFLPVLLLLEDESSLPSTTIPPNMVLQWYITVP